MTTMERTGGFEDFTSIKELPPIWEPWDYEDMLVMPKEETDRLFALLKTKMDIVNDIYGIQLFRKERVEARKDKQISVLGLFTDGR
jgi:hypothetical protein